MQLKSGVGAVLTYLCLNKAMGMTEAPIYVLMAVTFYYGTVMLSRGTAKPGDIILVAFSMIYGSAAVGSAMQQIEHFSVALVVAAKMFPIMDGVSGKTAVVHLLCSHSVIPSSLRVIDQEVIRLFT